jgi:hypothetical protein
MFSSFTRITRDAFAVQASESSIERVFSLSEHITTWQCNQLSAQSISQSIVYKVNSKTKW